MLQPGIWRTGNAPAGRRGGWGCAATSEASTMNGIENIAFANEFLSYAPVFAKKYSAKMNHPVVLRQRLRCWNRGETF
jgi:hypothetical protein